MFLTGMSSRKGTEKDGENLKKTFEDLGYNVKVFNDQTCNQIESCLLAVAQEDHSKEASFVCALLSHGDEGVLYGTDGCITMKKLTNCFGADYCATLVGKPKMFFIQACRGSGLDAGIEADSAEDETHYNDFPKEPDFLFAYSTVPVAKEDHRELACFACVLLSHGREGHISGTDTEIKIRLLASLFTGERCQSLLGKPKLFFIQDITLGETKFLVRFSSGPFVKC
ncbi:Caspase-3 [Acipenser ruthenus]|uniref:Caspase-3 n=1 Tax=Acipenser ruthenus TaxID=7906 RepID=A0A662YU32_ACIRT|nr:Caspase-3 [Acipenser ruthenus]